MILSKLSVLSAHEVENKLLQDFYKQMFSKRADMLSNYWQWYYRSSFFDNKIPLIILYDGRMIAHAGMIPFAVALEDKTYTASWFIDFAVLPEFQGHGIGTFLTKKWMEFSDIQVTFCNEKSMGIFRKLGWDESFNTYLHYYFLKPFNFHIFPKFIPGFVKNILNPLPSVFLRLIYQKYASFDNELNLENIKEESLSKLFIFCPKFQKDIALPVRDDDYIAWRLLISPDSDKYRVFTMDDVSMLIKLGKRGATQYIDILLTSDLSNHFVIRKMISSLALWGLNNNYSYIRFYISEAKLSNFLSQSLKSIVKHPRFMFYAKDAKLFEKMKHAKWHLGLIDSDFEWI